MNLNDYAGIAKVLDCPTSNVQKYWPPTKLCLESLNIGSRNVMIAALATIKVETLSFYPIHEFGSDAYLNRMYDTRTDLGNTPGLDGDGARYCGRGLIQITGKNNYIKYGKQLGIDLVNHPERALDADVSAAVFADFFLESKAAKHAELGEWESVRRAVNGGKNGLATFLKYVGRLNEALDLAAAATHA